MCVVGEYGDLEGLLLFFEKIKRQREMCVFCICVEGWVKRGAGGRGGNTTVK